MYSTYSLLRLCKMQLENTVKFRANIFLKYFAKPLDKHKIFCYNTKARNGRLAQLGEHLPYKQRVIGSSPILSTIRRFYLLFREWLGSSVG